MKRSQPQPWSIPEYVEMTPGLCNAGWCYRCQRWHRLPLAPAQEAVRHLQSALATYQRLDWQQKVANPQCSTRGLFEPGGGKMFGVLCCRDQYGQEQVLHAFSGLYNGMWEVPGWVGPICDPRIFAAVTGEPEKEIKRLSRILGSLSAQSAAYRQLKQARRALSQGLMQDIHKLYQLCNFRGERAALTTVFQGQKAPPAGTGDCCGPKLLQHAALHGLQPFALAEFFWGVPTSAAKRQHGRVYTVCARKCEPILGYMLCGMTDGRKESNTGAVSG